MLYLFLASEYFKLNHGISLLSAQMKAMVIKTWGFFKGNFKLLLLTYLVVVIFVCLISARNRDSKYLTNKVMSVKRWSRNCLDLAEKILDKQRDIAELSSDCVEFIKHTHQGCITDKDDSE